MSAERRSSARLLCALGVDLGTTNSTISEVLPVGGSHG
jgi:molecular chaperone DnaK (HSP70)